jgi:hypothetical protein
MTNPREKFLDLIEQRVNVPSDKVAEIVRASL